MWLFTKTGFYSIVEKPEDAPRLTIRARDRGDLVRLKKHYLPEMSKIVVLKQSDYEFRAFAPRQAVARMMSRIASEINYSNFKDEIFREQGLARSSLYHRVWTVLLELSRGPRPVSESLFSTIGEEVDRLYEFGD